jgi:hypothetical protein
MLRNPTTGIAGCCARAPSGHNTPAAIDLMRSRRRISPTQTQSYAKMLSKLGTSRHDILALRRCALGQKRRVDRAPITSGLPLPSNSDIAR